VIYVTAPAQQSKPPWRSSHVPNASKVQARAEILEAAEARAGCLVPVNCKVLVYPSHELLSDHYGVIATLAYDSPGEGPAGS
jgi:hypothetical protein